MEGAADTLGELLATWAAAAPDDVVLVERDGRRRRRRIGELVAATPARAAGLAALGAGRDRAVVAWLPNRIEYLEVLAAAGHLGAPLVGLNTRYRADELGHVLARSSAAVLVVVDEFAGTDFAAVARAAELPADLTVVVVDGDGAGWSGVPSVAWADLAGDPATLERGPTGADLLVAFTTSGTTGLPKVAVHDHAGTVRHAHADVAAFGMTAADHLLVDLPLCGTFGVTALLMAIAARATTSLHERFDPAASASVITDAAVTHYFAGDDMILRLLDSGALGRDLAWRAGGFANFVNAGTEVCERLERDHGVRVSGLYGMSEVFALAATWPTDWPAETRSRAGGIPVDPALAVTVIDPVTGAPVADGVEGELCFRGPQVFARYLADEGATAAVLGADGWFRSGDLGRSADGGFEFLARLGDSLRLRGFLVDPAEIERRLSLHPDVALAQVVGAERPGRGQVAVAFVMLRPGAAAGEAELRAYCAAGIAELKVPERIVVVDEFPTVDGPNGRKIRKVELRQRASALIT